MELVAKDIGGDWHFDGDKTYLCINAKGDEIGKIFAEYIPDPVLLWQSKCDAAGIHISDARAKVLKSNEVIYKLWNHKNAIQE
jgi:hypothetical protein